VQHELFYVVGGKWLVLFYVPSNCVPNRAVAAIKPAADGSFGHTVAPAVNKHSDIRVLQNCTGLQITGSDHDSVVVWTQPSKGHERNDKATQGEYVPLHSEADSISAGRDSVCWFQRLIRRKLSYPDLLLRRKDQPPSRPSVFHNKIFAM